MATPDEIRTLQNERFEASTPEERRVLIARDVIAGLALNVFRPTRGQFVLDADGGDVPIEQAQTLADSRVPCEVCAVGALFVSSLALYDRFERDFSGPIWSDDFVSANAKEFVRLNYFSGPQADLIEVAFEGVTTHVWEDEVDLEGVEDALAFGEEWALNPVERLAAIMQNIVENNGEFVPSQEPKTDMLESARRTATEVLEAQATAAEVLGEAG